MHSEENSQYFKLDFANKYYLKSPKKLNYYLMGGFSWQYLIKSELTITDSIQDVVNPYNAVDSWDTHILYKYDTKKMRSPNVFCLLVGAGLVYRIGDIGIGLDIRGYYSLNNLNIKSERFQPRLIQDFNYIDNNTSLIKTDYSVVFTYLLYKVKRKKTV